jgi:hypothetical protein
LFIQTEFFYRVSRGMDGHGALEQRRKGERTREVG